MTLIKDTISAASIYDHYTTTVRIADTTNPKTYTTHTSTYETPAYIREIENLKERNETLNRLLGEKERQVTMLLEILNAHLGKQV